LKNWNIIRLVTGIGLLILGISQFTFGQSRYLFGTGLVIWGAGSIFLAWANKNGSKTVRTAAGIVYLVGCVVTIIGVFLRY
jgi:hypothetical protein